MRLTAITFGSRGDVEPFATLSKGLVDAGHRVRLLTHPEYAPLLSGSGVEFMAARGRSTQELLESDEGREVLRHARTPVTMLRRIAEVLAPELQLIYEDTVQACLDADAVLAFPSTFPALEVAEHLGRRIIHVHHVPAVPTSRFPIPAPYVRARTLTRLGNRASYTLDAWLLWQLTHTAAGGPRRDVLGPAGGRLRLRRALAQRRKRAGAIVGVSRHVLPPPPDWPADVVTCGYWWPSGTDGGPPDLPEDLGRFLADGPAPVFLSLGSTPVADPVAVTEQIAGAAHDARVRLILQQGWAGLGFRLADHPDLHVAEHLPYDAIFPHVAAVAHHGGAGTTALGLRHGRPTLCLPALADQFFWGHRVRAIGAGPPPLPLARLRRDRLAERLADLAANPAYATRTSEIAPALVREDGATRAVRAIEHFLQAPAH